MKGSGSVFLVLASLVLSACVSPGAQESSLQDPTPAALQEFQRYARQFKRDYDPAMTPAHLKRASDIVATGTVVGVEVGQSYAPASGVRARITTSVLEIEMDEMLSGESTLVWGGSIFVEVPHPAFVGISDGSQKRVPFDHAEFEATVPHSYGIFFLVDRTEEPYWETIIDKGSGRPVGAPLTASLVQGFLIEDDRGRLWSINEPLDAMPEPWRTLETVDEVKSQVSSE